METEHAAGHGTRRRQQKEATREVILETARALFAQEGYEKATIREVARRAGVGLGTVCSHFPDKSSLLIAALLDDLARTQAEAMATLPPPATRVCDRFLHLAQRFYAYYAQRPDLSRILLRNMWFQEGIWAAELKSQADAFILLVAGMIGQARDRGEIRADVDCHLAAMAFFSHYLNVLLKGLGEGDFQPGASLDLLRRLLGQLLRGVGAGEVVS